MLVGVGGGNDEESGNKMKWMIYIIDSMIREELDLDGSLFFVFVKIKVIWVE